MGSWHEFAWQADEPDPGRDRLCAGRQGSTRLDCRVEGADFTAAPAPLTDELVICAYNVERGLRLDEQLAAFANDAEMPTPDVLLISEADRGCTRSGDRNVAREYARALGMYYVYGVEFIELPRVVGPSGRIRTRCEHGNAIVSRYPLGNVRAIRHERTRSWNSPVQRLLRVGQPRFGGRVAVTADVRVGERLLRVYSVHFESGHLRFGPRRRDGYRRAQAGELVDDVAGLEHGVVIGGDMNVVGFLDSLGDRGAPEPTTAALAEAGFDDAHATLAPSERITTDDGLVIDVIVGRGVRFVESGVGRRDTWGGLSDHLPVWTRLGW
jgi:endonuclease/exonuclease/phosphatase family metal-dependent hydrolase